MGRASSREKNRLADSETMIGRRDSLGTGVSILVEENDRVRWKFSVSNQVRRNVTILIVLLVLAGGLRLWGIGWGLPQVYEEGIPLRHA